MWRSKQEIEKHLEAAWRLEHIKNHAFAYLCSHPTVSEYDVQQIILEQFKTHGLKNYVDVPIVAFGASTADPHYFPKKRSAKKLKPNSVVMIDIWGKINEKDAPYADITWMGFYGKRVPKTIQQGFGAVIAARDGAVVMIKKSLQKKIFPTGQEVDNHTNSILQQRGFGTRLKHRTGHSIGYVSPHGRWGHVSFRNKNRLKPNLGYTIEPGVYIDGKFGIRSEINFYITEEMKLVVTTKTQKEFIMI